MYARLSAARGFASVACHARDMSPTDTVAPFSAFPHTRPAPALDPPPSTVMPATALLLLLLHKLLYSFTQASAIGLTVDEPAMLMLAVLALLLLGPQSATTLPDAADADPAVEVTTAATATRRGSILCMRGERASAAAADDDGGDVDGVLTIMLWTVRRQQKTSKQLQSAVTIWDSQFQFAG
jgi:hypothetical protein